jgi:hypothetical protein
MQRQNRPTIRFIHSLDDTKYLRSDSPLRLTINSMHHIHFLFGFPRLLLCLIDLSVMNRMLLVINIIVSLLDFLVHNIHGSALLVMKRPVLLREDLQADLIPAETTILIFKTEDKQVIGETVNLHGGFVRVLSRDIQSTLEEFALSDTQYHFLETEMVFIERRTFRKIKLFFIL